MSLPINVPSESSYHGGSSSGKNRPLNRIIITGRSQASPGHQVRAPGEDESATLTSFQIREQTLSHTWKELSLGSSVIRAHRNTPTITLGESPADHQSGMSGFRHRGPVQRSLSDGNRPSLEAETGRKSSIDDRSNSKPPSLVTSFDPPLLFRHDDTTARAERDDDSDLTPKPAHSVSSATNIHHPKSGKSPTNRNASKSLNSASNNDAEIHGNRQFSSALQHLTRSFQQQQLADRFDASERTPLLASPPSLPTSNDGTYSVASTSGSSSSHDIESFLNNNVTFEKVDDAEYAQESGRSATDEIGIVVDDHVDQHTPLLNTESEEDLTPKAWMYAQTHKILSHAPKNIASVSITGLKSIPAVSLGLMLNVLDAMSYGVIVFPASDSRMPKTVTNSGISMFLASSIIAQFVYTFGGSGFKGVNGSMMIEVMPFLHIMVRIIEARIVNGDQTQHELMATVMVAYSMSTILTGVAFLLLGYFKLGNVLQFFPRHILVGCIGGIGIFLVQTAVEVTTGIKPFYTWEYFKAICELSAFKLWVFVLGVSMDRLRHDGWLFDLPAGDDSFATFWTYFDFRATRWDCLPDVLPTMLALTFFGVLHVPINVPALAVSTDQDVDTNGELIGHGISNLLAGVAGTTQNYLVYSNSVLFYRSGGKSRISAFLLGVSTIGIWVGGGKIAGYVPTVAVGSLIFHLGLDLLRESLWDSVWVGIHPLEYLTVVLIVATMGIFGFTEGIIAGIIFACIFFVVMYAGKRVIRADYTGKELRSTVHRLYVHQLFLDKVGTQIRVLKLQGFIFFGSINQLDDYLRKLIRGRAKVRFVVLDFALISDIDFSAMEAFLRITKTLREKNIHLVFCVFGHVGKELASVGVVNRENSDWVHVFGTLNGALEWCENCLLDSYYKRTERTRTELLRQAAAEAAAANGNTDDAAAAGYESSGQATRASTPIPTPLKRVDSMLSASLIHASPRQVQVDEAAKQVVSTDPHMSTVPEEIHPVELLIRAFSRVSDASRDVLARLAPQFERTAVGPNGVMWEPNDESTELLVVESGDLLMEYIEVDRGAAKVVETCVPGVMIGELEMFAGRPRTSRVRAGQSGAVLWRLRASVFDELCENEPSVALNFMKLSLGFDGVRVYNVISHAFHAMD
ncbi:hypothetical protein SeMB42_g00542 [Synchytrium endobioticum]|uniref:STAS domain-containing protein n=1 Tax=Synchytrium endobioticum TaxID=286115 RepID=A0A507DQI5_9FUNG|nr:hypothetical protein SeMB42_g00542 [Synchytrium endobioticum]